MNAREAKIKLTVLNVLQYAVWGSYLISMGGYLTSVGLGKYIGLFYATQGIVTLFMPAIMGMVADRWLPARRTYALCMVLASMGLCGMGVYGFACGSHLQLGILFACYAVGTLFFMPTVSLAVSVAFHTMDAAGLDKVNDFPSIRMFGTVGFVLAMWAVDWLGFQHSAMQFVLAGVLALCVAAWSCLLPACSVCKAEASASLAERLGLRAFALFRDRHLAMFFVFSMLIGVVQQVTDGFANPYISSFSLEEAYAHSFGVNHINTLISLSQCSEVVMILLLPFCMKRWGIKRVFAISMAAWVLRFLLLGAGNPGDGVWLFVLSMVVYGVAFNFYCISGSLYVDQVTSPNMRSSAQGLLSLMTSGVGAVIGSWGAQWLVNHYTTATEVGGVTYQVGQWGTVWLLMAAYVGVVMGVFALIFKERKDNITNKDIER